MPTTLQVELGAHHDFRKAIEHLLAGSGSEPGLLQGLLDYIGSLLADLADDPTVPRSLGVEVVRNAGLVEIRIPRGQVVDTLLCDLG